MKSKRKIHILSLLLCAVLLVSVLSGCSSKENFIYTQPEESAAPQTSLTFFGFKYEALNVMEIEKILYSYMTLHSDINISYDGIKTPDYFAVLNKRLETDNGDDIFMVDHERTLELGRQKRLADLSDLSTLDNFSDLAKSQIFADGAVDYLPTTVSAFGLYCNLDLLSAHGQAVPQNLAEFEAVCDYFVSQGITPIVANNDISLKTVVLAKSLLPLYQSEDIAAKIERFNSGQDDFSQALLPGFELVEKMLRRGWVNGEEALGVSKTKDDLVLFAQGERPFMLTGVWATVRLRELQPDFQFAVYPYPIMEDGSVLVVNMDTRISINAESPHIEEAKRFVEYLTQDDVLWSFVNNQSSFSPLQESRLADDQAIQPISPYLTNGRSVLGSDDNLRFPVWDMTRQCITGMLSGDSAETAAAAMRRLFAEWKNAETEG
ncbi:MAG: ABC transporter substrate-binding protein [Oscillospiraceae bacterium]|nr:ABC transporter substrate-binding protein [Oscillospiraceae bacterium]